MASAIAHFIVGASVALPAVESKAINTVLPKWTIPVSAGLAAVVPDVDTLVMEMIGVPYASFFGHRGFFHSPFFLLASSAILAAIVFRGKPWPAIGRVAALWGASAVTHPLLDAMTDGGLGVMLLFPISSERLFLPWRPIHVSPLSIRRFFDSAGYILESELPFCVLAAAIGLLGLSARRLKLSPLRPKPPSRNGRRN